VPIQKWLFCPISAPALPAQWNALEVIFHRGGMRSLFLWGYAQILILEMYGMTENAATLTSNPPDLQKPGSVGRALGGMEIRVVDNTGRRLPTGQVGEILAKGPGLMKGYYKRPDLTAKVLRGGWYHTGDLGRMDEDGFLYIVDRKDDMINAGAFKIYPREVEDVLYGHPSVADCAVVGQTDERLGQVPVAYIVPKEREGGDGEELRHFCRNRMANYKAPRRYHFVTKLPRTAQGKIMRRRLAG
jgi:long-chain acyl-CoA synthetase